MDSPRRLNWWITSACRHHGLLINWNGWLIAGWYVRAGKVGHVRTDLAPRFRSRNKKGRTC